MEKIKNFIYYKVIYKVMKIFPVYEKRVIFESFYGNSYSCNPKYIYKEMLKEKSEFEFIWVYNKDEIPKEIEGCKIVKRRSLEFLYYFATSKFWITNCNMPSSLKPGKDNIYVQTWHGVPLKKIGSDMNVDTNSRKEEWKVDGENIDLFVSSSSELNSIYERALNIDKSKLKVVGSPRNDVLFNQNIKNDIKQKLEEKYNINLNKKVILYAPTFRDDNLKQDINLDLQFLKENLEDDYIIFLRLHSNVSNKLNIDNSLKNFIYDLSSYDDVQELFIISEVLITDYSSVMFDFAITEKTMIFYPYDLGHYDNNIRGFYFDYNEVPGPIVYNTMELCKSIIEYDKDIYSEKIKSFATKYETFNDGKACERIVDILDEIGANHGR